VRQAELAGHHNAVNAARNRYNDVQRIEEDVMVSSFQYLHIHISRLICISLKN
jgi:hypothetical protein